MADIVTTEQLQNASLDAQALEKFINGSDSETVLTRLSANYPTIKKAIKELFESGGIAGRFKTLAQLQASSLADGAYALVADDAIDKNGVYIKEGGTWKKSKYDLAQLTSDVFNDRSKSMVRVVDKYSELYRTNKSGEFYYVLEDKKLYRFVKAETDESKFLKETNTYLAALPNKISLSHNKTVINQLFASLKRSGIFDKLSGLWVARTSSYNNSCVNLIDPSKTLTPTSWSGDFTGSWDSERGAWEYNSDNFKTRFDTGMPLSPQEGQYNYSADRQSFGVVYYQTTSYPEARYLMGNVTTDSKGSSVSLVNSSLDYRLNSAAYIPTPITDYSQIKLGYHSLHIGRLGDTVISYMDGKQKGEALSPLNTENTGNYIIGAISPSYLTSKPMYFAYVGDYLNSSEVAELSRILLEYIEYFARPELTVGSLREVTSSTDSEIGSYLSPAPTASEAALSTSLTVDIGKTHQEYLGGYIEIQPDSWTGTHNTATDATTETWGFPHSLMPSEQARLRNDLFKGDGYGLQYIRFPLGYAYRGYRNIDPVSGLARNIGERYAGQNTALRRLFENISKAGGGLAPEYWCPPVHWLTSGSYHGGNQITAGGTYPRSTTLASIRSSDPTQYAAQIDAFTSAIVDDYEYLHKNIAPVRMYGLSNEPQYSKTMYGACSFDAETYSDIVMTLYVKVNASKVLAIYDGEPNKPLLHVASDDTSGNPWVRAKKIEEQHPEYIWGFSHHLIRHVSGESSAQGGDYYTTQEFKGLVKDRKNVFLNEYEYFSPTSTTHSYKCSNNMLAYINSLLYSDSRVIMPIIHVCKELGATKAETNTEGYALLQCNLQKGYGLAPDSPNNTAKQWYGTYRPVTHNYNSWRFIADNMPIGSVRVGDPMQGKPEKVSCLTMMFEGKLRLFLVNARTEPVKLTITLPRNILFHGRSYNLKSCGDVIKPKKGQSITFVVPPETGEAWIEQ